MVFRIYSHTTTALHFHLSSSQAKSESCFDRLLLIIWRSLASGSLSYHISFFVFSAGFILSKNIFNNSNDGIWKVLGKKSIFIFKRTINYQVINKGKSTTQYLLRQYWNQMIDWHNCVKASLVSALSSLLELQTFLLPSKANTGKWQKVPSLATNHRYFTRDKRRKF